MENVFSPMSFGVPFCGCACDDDKNYEFTTRRLPEPFGAPADLPDLPDDLPEKTPEKAGCLTYTATADQPLHGVPIREGPLLLLLAEEEVAKVNFSLYVNGFVFSHLDREHSFALSPFSLVRTCRFQATTSEGVKLTDVKCFKVCLFTQGACFYLGVAGSKAEGGDAEEERSRWVLDISRAICLVTQSLFPPFRIMCEPLEAVPMTKDRLMAGYLLHSDDAAVVSALYCELHPQSDGDPPNDHAKLVLYENETCQKVLVRIKITLRSTTSEKLGVSCSCFSVDDQLFAARTLAERKLWLRAIANVKVKLQNHALRPEAAELQQYRGAILDHMRANRADFQSHMPVNALLQRQTTLGELGL